MYPLRNENVHEWIRRYCIAFPCGQIIVVFAVMAAVERNCQSLVWNLFCCVEFVPGSTCSITDKLISNFTAHDLFWTLSRGDFWDGAPKACGGTKR